MPLRPLLAFLLLASTALAQAPATRPAFPPDEEGIEFARVDGRALTLDLYLPKDRAGTVPLVICIHGGGWQNGNKAALARQARAFADAGFAAISISYRLSGVAKWPAQIHDVKAAIRWARAHAAQRGFDPARFATFGTSAGGHLAAFAGVTSGVRTHTVGGVTLDLEGDVGDHDGESSAVQVVLNFFGPTDFLRMRDHPSRIDHEAATSPESKLVGAPIRSVPDLVALANPVTFVDPRDPPMFTAHGRDDALVPFAQGELLHAALREAGVDSVLLDIGSAGHGDAAFWRAGALEAAIGFLQRRFAPAAASR